MTDTGNRRRPRYEIIDTDTGEVMARTSRMRQPAWLKATVVGATTLLSFGILGTVAGPHHHDHGAPPKPVVKHVHVVKVVDPPKPKAPPINHTAPAKPKTLAGDDNHDGVIDEDESGFNCKTMGNHVCGTGTPADGFVNRH